MRTNIGYHLRYLALIFSYSGEVVMAGSGLTHSPGLARSLGRGSAFMLMAGKVLKGFQRIGSGEIQPATRAEKASAAALGAFIHQGWPGYRSGRQFSQNGFLARIVRLRAQVASKIVNWFDWATSV
jgi:hypothetical protein